MMMIPLLPRPWSRPFGGVGRGPLDVDLAVAELVARGEHARARPGDEGAVLDLPRGLAVARTPAGQVLAVEQDDRVRRRLAGRLLRAGRAGRDDGRLGPVAVVDVPLAAGQHRRVLEAQLRLVLADEDRGNREDRRGARGEGGRESTDHGIGTSGRELTAPDDTAGCSHDAAAVGRATGAGPRRGMRERWIGKQKAQGTRPTGWRSTFSGPLSALRLPPLCLLPSASTARR